MKITVLTVVLAAAYAGGAVGAAHASPEPAFSAACGTSAGQVYVAMCERLDYIASQSSEGDSIVQGVEWGVGLLVLLAVAPVLFKTFGSGGS